MYEMSFKLHQIRCNFPDISYISETQKNNFQFLNKWQFLDEKKKVIFFLIFAQNIDLGYTSEPPH